MAFNYDSLYGSTPQALGEPTQVFVDFFNQHPEKTLSVLDVGCGQGRDAVFIARLGHYVVGVDISPNGIKDLLSMARAENLNIEGITADIATFSPQGQFDVILIDRTLHMLPEADRLTALARLLDCVTAKGWVLIADEASNMAGFKTVFAENAQEWRTELDARGNLFLQRRAIAFGSCCYQVTENAA